ncbi:MAG: hypothetical protein RI928_1978 [Pseudomonadota bacterium]
MYTISSISSRLLPRLLLTTEIAIASMVLASTAFAQNTNNKPACSGDDPSKWNACIGSASADYGTYTGEFRKGKFDGQGTLNFTNGEIYIGQFKEGNAQGIGLHIKTNGERYAGGFVANNYQGKGILQGADGKVISEGVWEKDKFVRAEKISDASIRALLVADKRDNEKPTSPNPANAGPVNAAKIAPLTIYVKKRADWLQMIKDIDGKNTLAHPEQLSGRRLSVCLLVNEKDYGSQGLVHLRETLAAALKNYFSGLGSGLKPVAIDFLGMQPYDPKLEYQKEFSHQTDCWNWYRNVLEVQMADLVIARSQDEKYLVKKVPIPGVMVNPMRAENFSVAVNNAYDNNFGDGFDVLGQLTGEALATTHQAVAAEQSKKTAEQAERMTEFKKLAEQNSHDSVVSVTVGYISDRQMGAELQICSLAHENADKLAIEGFGTLGMAPYSEGMKQSMAKATDTPRINSAIKTFPDLKAFYADYQKGTSCHVFVDFPANVSKLMDAIRRDKPTAMAELNMIQSAESLRDKLVAARTEFTTYADYQFASSIGASARDLKTLASNGAGDAAGFAKLAEEMQKAGYSNSQRASDVVRYISDRKEGGSPQGAIKVREARQAAQAKAEKEAAERRRKLDAMRAKKSFRMGVVCVGLNTVSSAEMNIALNMYANNTHVQAIASFITGSNSCMLRDATLRGEQLSEVSRSGRFVGVRAAGATESNAMYGIIPAETWDNP